MKTAAILALVPLALAAPASIVNKREGGPAPILRPRDAKLLKDKYIVKLRTGSTVAAVNDAMDLFEGDADHVYTVDGFKGFSATLDGAALDAITNHPEVSLNLLVSRTR